jgi:hypothetical protein
MSFSPGIGSSIAGDPPVDSAAPQLVSPAPNPRAPARIETASLQIPAVDANRLIRVFMSKGLNGIRGRFLQAFMMDRRNSGAISSETL